MSDTPIRITIGSRTLSATLWDNPTGNALLDQLPATLTFEDYGRQEVIATPPRPFTMAGMPAGDDPGTLVARKRDPGPLFPWPRVLAATPLQRGVSTSSMRSSH